MVKEAGLETDSEASGHEDEEINDENAAVKKAQKAVGERDTVQTRRHVHGVSNGILLHERSCQNDENGYIPIYGNTWQTRMRRA